MTRTRIRYDFHSILKCSIACAYLTNPRMLTEAPFNTTVKNTPKFCTIQVLEELKILPALRNSKVSKIHSYDIMQTLACLSHKIVWHCRLIHQLDITMVHIVLASGWPCLPVYCNGEL